MPIYEYRCQACGHHVEVIQKMGARPLRKCSECSGKLEKLVSRTSFHLKGGGWYNEGYDKRGKSNSDSSSSSSSSSSSDSSSKSSSSSSDSSSKSKKAPKGKAAS